MSKRKMSQELSLPSFASYLQRYAKPTRDNAPPGWDTYPDGNGAKWSAWLYRWAYSAPKLDAHLPVTDTSGYPERILSYLRLLCDIEMQRLGAWELRVNGLINWNPSSEVTQLVTRVAYCKNGEWDWFTVELHILNLSDLCL
jgi:hypothetical protein